jgi:arylformamidase
MSGGIHRRAVLASAAGALAAAPALAQQPPAPPAHAKGPRVFLDYDQAELDAAYDQAVYAPNEDQILKRYASNSELTRHRLGVPERFPYGPSDIEKLDVFRAKRPKAPIHVFIHGGAWRGQVAKDYAFPADMLVAAGVAYVVPDFVAVQNANGSLLPMAEQVRRAIAWVYKNAPRIGGDRERIHVSGHSSGGHLCAVALVANWNEHGVPDDVVKGVLCISGLYDLKPVRLSARSSYVRFTDGMEEQLSPIRHLDRLRTPLLVAYGSNETPEFQRQNRDFAAAVQATGKPVQLIRAENYNHFELVETLANPQGILGRAALAQMKLGPA